MVPIPTQQMLLYILPALVTLRLVLTAIRGSVGKTVCFQIPGVHYNIGNPFPNLMLKDKDISYIAKLLL